MHELVNIWLLSMQYLYMFNKKKMKVWKSRSLEIIAIQQKKKNFYVKEGNGHFKNYEEVVKGRRMNGEMETIFFSFWEEFSTSSITETRNITG